MQTGKEQIKRQQLILTLKGFYHGAIDGIWSAKTVEAKKKWEATGKGFVPGIPNNGLPFSNHGPYPKGVILKDGLLSCVEVDEYFAKLKAEEAETESK